MNPYLTEQSPAFAKGFGDLGVVHLWGRLDDLVPLDLAPHHERIHRSFDVVRRRLLRLKKSTMGESVLLYPAHALRVA